MGLMAFITSLNSASVPQVPEPPPDEILFGDTEILWGSTTVTFND